MLTLIRSGTRYPLDDGSLAYLLAYDGWGLPSMHRLQTRGPLQHGEFNLGFRLDARTGQLVLLVKGDSRADMLSRTEALIRLFRPASDTPVLEWSYGDIIRLIDVVTIGDMTVPSSDQSGFSQKVVITLKANDPTFYSPTDQTITFKAGIGEDTGVIPMPVPTPVGTGTINQSVIVKYAGSWETYPYIRIVGPITDCIITNATTGDKLDFTEITISSEDYYDIDTRYGYKTVTNKLGGNRIMDLTTDSDLATFRLAAEPEAMQGENNILVTGTSAGEETQIIFGWRERYLSM